VILYLNNVTYISAVYQAITIINLIALEI